MDNEAGLRYIVKSLLESQKFAVLATQKGRKPYLNLIAFAATQDLSSIVFFTPRASRKYINIAANSNIALLIDNRSNRASDIQKASTITLLGSAQEVAEAERKMLSEVYLAKHPNLEEFATSPRNAMIKIKAEKYIVVKKFKEVDVLDMLG